MCVKRILDMGESANIIYAYKGGYFFSHQADIRYMRIKSGHYIAKKDLTNA